MHRTQVDQVTRCVLLNGPAGCGKDTLADLLSEYGFAKYQFKEILYKRTAEHYRVPLRVVRFVCSERSLKEEACAMFYGKSPREALIHVSERCIKPAKGVDYFGVEAVKQCKNNCDRSVVFSDSGFVEESIPVINHFDDTLILRMHRKGFSFDGDSRNYLPDMPGARCIDIEVEEGDPGKPIDDVLEWFHGVETVA